jgi:hypothetical protein
MTYSRAVTIVAFFFLSLPYMLYAQQSNFMISPPPIPWFEFKEGQKDLRLNATTLYLTGENSGSIEGDTDVYGGGAGGVYRYAFKDIFAFDLGLTVFGTIGDIGEDANMTMWLASLPLDLEIQFINNEYITVIGFIGFCFSRNYIEIDSDIPGYEGTVDMTTTMRGPQGGVQVSFKLGNFILSPFLMLTKQSGDVDIDYDIEGEGSGSLSLSVSSSTMKYYGFEVVYVPLGLSLNSFIQLASESGDNNGYKTYVLSIGYSPKL